MATYGNLRLELATHRGAEGERGGAGQTGGQADSCICLPLFCWLTRVLFAASATVAKPCCVWCVQTVKRFYAQMFCQADRAAHKTDSRLGGGGWRLVRWKMSLDTAKVLATV